MPSSSCVSRKCTIVQPARSNLTPSSPPHHCSMRLMASVAPRQDDSISHGMYPLPLPPPSFLHRYALRRSRCIRRTIENKHRRFRRRASRSDPIPDRSRPIYDARTDLFSRMHPRSPTIVIGGNRGAMIRRPTTSPPPPPPPPSPRLLRSYNILPTWAKLAAASYGRRVR